MSNPFSGARRPSHCQPPLALALALLCAAALADAKDDRGEALYENHCGECHAATVHDREHRLVDSREELRGWVAAWSTHAGLGWKDEEIESVTSYLSRRLYGFTR